MLGISDVLRAVLDYDGIDAVELAGRMGRNPGVVGKWVRGDALPRLDAVVEIAKALNAPVDVFVSPPETRDGVFARMLAHRAVRAIEQGG